MQRPQHAPVIQTVVRPEYPDIIALAPELLFVPIHTDTQMSIRIWFPKGPLDSPLLNPMSTALADRLALRAAGGLGTQGFHDARIKALCHLGVHTTAQSSEIHLKCPPTSLEQGLALVDSLIRAPDFDSDGFENIRRERIDALKYTDRDPWHRSNRSVASRLWGEQATRARWSVDRVEDYETATLHEAQRSWADRFQSTNPMILCAGPMSPEVLRSRLRTTFPLAPRPAPITPNYVCAPQPGTVTLVNAFDEQTFLRLDVLIPNHRENALAAKVAAYALNGLYGRMAKVLRIEKGWTYHCDADAQVLGDQILFTVGCSVQSDVVEEALAFMQQTLRGLQGGVTESELEASKQNDASDAWYRAFVSSNHTSALSVLLDKGITPERRSDRIAAAYSQTLEQINQTLAQWNFQQMFTTIIRPE